MMDLLAIERGDLCEWQKHERSNLTPPPPPLAQFDQSRSSEPTISFASEPHLQMVLFCSNFPPQLLCLSPLYLLHFVMLANSPFLEEID